MVITLDDLKAVDNSKNEDRLIKLLGDFNRYCSIYAIDSKLRIAAFLAQAAHETGGWKYFTEIGGPKYFTKYDDRRDLGNTHNGDGYLYRGRGIFQLTGRNNYIKYGKFIGVDLESKPELAAQSPYAVMIACDYWMRHDLNTLADSGNFREITRRINGGYNGLEDRISKYNKLLSILT